MYDSQTLKSRRNLMRLFWPVCQKKTWTWNWKTYFRIPDLSLITIVTCTGHLTLLSLQFLICKTGMIIAAFKVTVMIQWSSLQHIGLAQKFLWDTWPHIGISYMLVLFLPPTGFITGPSEIDEILLCLDLRKGGSICQSPLLVFPKSFCWDVSPYLSSQRNYFLLCASHTIVITILAVTPKSLDKGHLFAAILGVLVFRPEIFPYKLILNLKENHMWKGARYPNNWREAFPCTIFFQVAGLTCLFDPLKDQLSLWLWSEHHWFYGLTWKCLGLKGHVCNSPSGVWVCLCLCLSLNNRGEKEGMMQVCVCVCLNKRGEKEGTMQVCVCVSVCLSVCLSEQEGRGGDDAMAVVTVLTVGELRCVELFVPFLELSSKFAAVV